MAIKTFYVKNSFIPTGSTVKFTALQDGGTAPSTTSLTTIGWLLGTGNLSSPYNLISTDTSTLYNTNGTGNSSSLLNVPSLSNPLSGFRSESPLTCDISAGTWTFSFSLIATTTATGSGKLRFRIWKSSESTPGYITDGSSAVEITSTVLETNVWSNLTTSTAQNLTTTVSLPLIELRNQYLFIQIEHQLLSLNDSSSAAIVFRADATNSKISTPNFANAYAGNLKYSQINLTTGEYDRREIGFDNKKEIILSTGELYKTVLANCSIETTGGIAYYLMRGKDDTGYKSWIAINGPDLTASQYTGTINGQMTNIVVLQAWYN